MYNKVISKIRCYSPNKKNTPIRNYNNLYYIATREGVDLHPLEEELGESAHAANNETYTKYIHERPRSNGLFGNIDTSDILTVCGIMRNISDKQCVYRGILSLSEDDAVELGFMNKAAWRDFLTASLPEISEILGIPTAEMKWVAAFHQEKGHPHVHYMIWSDNFDHIQNPFISVPQQHKCRELFSKRFFAEERSLLNHYKNQSRSNVLFQGKELSKTDLQRLVDEITVQPSFQYLHHVHTELLESSSQELMKLLKLLPTQGSIKYAYLPPDAKSQVDKIVQTMLKKSELASEYNNFLNYHTKIAETYSPTKKELKVAILKAKKDIDIRLANLVLQSARELRKDKDFYYHLLQTSLPSYKSLFREGITDNTIDALKIEADAGDINAAYLLGRIYDDSNSTYHNPTEAFRYYKQAADGGDAMAQGILGSKYIWGKDIEADEELGREFLHSAQEQGNKYANDTEEAYDTFRKERSIYKSLSLMSDLLNSLCFANYTRRPSSVYQEVFDKNNKKVMREKARRKPHKHVEHLER